MEAAAISDLAMPSTFGGGSSGTRTDSTSTTTPTTNTDSIPRSTRRGSGGNGADGNTIPHRFPPWNPSPNVDENGFLTNKYQRVPGEWEKEVNLRQKDQIPIPTRYVGMSNSDNDQRHQMQQLSNDARSPSRSSSSSLSSSAASAAAPAMVTIRQVPGDGNCLFHSISICLAHAQNGTHLDMRSTESMQWLYQLSTKLRHLAVDILALRRKLLYLQGREYLKAKELVDAASAQYGITGTQYCDLMRQDSYWGGGPEIVALCNVLQRPIHVYELHVPTEAEQPQQRPSHSTRSSARGGRSNDNSNTKDGVVPTPPDSSPSSSAAGGFVLRRMACFGSPKFDRSPALHILSTDSRFPDVTPGKQLPSGNHFMALFPDLPPRHQRKNDEDDEDEEGEERKEQLRGGYVSREKSPARGWYSRLWSWL
jgi:hypothetical protein